MVLDDEDSGGAEEDYDISEFYDDEDFDDEDEIEEYNPRGVEEDEETFEPQWFENGLDENEIPTLVLVKQLFLEFLVLHSLLLELL